MSCRGKPDEEFTSAELADCDEAAASAAVRMCPMQAIRLGA
ncbi:ferredoxin [Parafrankia sp. FMc2]